MLNTPAEQQELGVTLSRARLSQAGYYDCYYDCLVLTKTHVCLFDLHFCTQVSLGTCFAMKQKAIMAGRAKQQILSYGLKLPCLCL